MDYTLRPTRPEETATLEDLIRLSARGLSRDDYTDIEIETCVAHVFGVDSELVADGTYYVVDVAGQPVACGGWSKRKTLFGGDNYQGRESGYLDPLAEAAKIRAFFVHPDFARRGLGTAILRHCESEARKAGFTRMEMMATLPGVKLYRALGYEGEAIQTFDMPNGVRLRFMSMARDLGPQLAR